MNTTGEYTFFYLLPSQINGYELINFFPNFDRF